MTDIPELVLSPGIPQTFPSPHPIVTKARKAGCKIICDIELLARAETKAAYVGITGTNGKSTTTALIGHILKNIGKRSAIGGNIGEPALTLTAMGPNGVYALELSSYQLELISSKIFKQNPLFNLPYLYVKLGLGEITEPKILGNDIYPDQTTLLRHIDCGDWILKKDGSKVQVL